MMDKNVALLTKLNKNLGAGKSSKTTEIYPAQFHPALLHGAWIHCARVYNHVTNKSLSSITSPLDSLNKRDNIEDKHHP